MHVVPCELDGPVIIEPKVFIDARGFFCELWNRSRFAGCGLNPEFAQDNLSLSSRNTLRGLHFQNPTAQAKLVTVLQGEVFDVVVDIRRTSPTFGRWVGVMLSGENRRQLYVPQGFAHGFAVTSETALFHYKVTASYAPEDEVTIRWDDPDLGIRWPVQSPLLSGRDAQAPRLRDIPRARLFD